MNETDRLAGTGRKGDKTLNDEHQYDDIINLRHYSSPSRPRMPRMNRAAQFAPFAALTGYDDAVAETARLTDKKRELTEDEKIMLSERIRILSENAYKRPVVEITYFLSDSRKEGGSYKKISGAVRRVDEVEMKVIFTDGTRVDISDICGIEGDIFDSIDIIKK